ncbi:host attachment protein [Ectothiorhodospiraceae bacterium WFHF3C12]|nr:host attachment protein [Ectothiorhodospiraceae bacterium WFHF3C12]
MEKIWILVADETRARFFQADSPRGGLTELEVLVHPEDRLHERELSTAKAGRAAGGQGQGAHGLEGDRSRHEVELGHFVREIAQHLEKGMQSGSFDRLTLCAGPKLLGLIREALPKAVREHVHQEVHKDLARMKQPRDIRVHLPERL